MLRVIITNGTGGSGKDTFCKYAATEINERKDIHAVSNRYSYVDWTRHVLQLLNFDTDNKTPAMRTLLADMNRAFEEYDDIPFKMCVKKIEQQERWDKQYPCDYYLFLDVRSPEVIDRFKAKYPNILTVLIDRGTLNTDTELDSGVYNYNYDYVVKNTGTLDDLRVEAERFVEKLVKGEI